MQLRRLDGKRFQTQLNHLSQHDAELRLSSQQRGAVISGRPFCDGAWEHFTAYCDGESWGCCTVSATLRSSSTHCRERLVALSLGLLCKYLHERTETGYIKYTVLFTCPFIESTQDWSFPLNLPCVLEILLCD